MESAKRYKLVIFDLDGTLIDTLEDLGAAVNHTLEKRGLPLHTMPEYRAMVGHGTRNLITQALPAHLRGDESLIDSCQADFMSYYRAHIADLTAPYPGMQELLAELHDAGILLAVASNKFQEGTETLVAKFFPGINFVAVLGNRPGAPFKPDPGIVREILSKAGAAPSETVMAGDSETDMKTAENGGIGRIAVTWGYRSLQGSPGLTIASTASQLRTLLMG